MASHLTLEQYRDWVFAQTNNGNVSNGQEPPTSSLPRNDATWADQGHWGGSATAEVVDDEYGASGYDAMMNTHVLWGAESSAYAPMNDLNFGGSTSGDVATVQQSFASDNYTFNYIPPYQPKWDTNGLIDPAISTPFNTPSVPAHRDYYRQNQQSYGSYQPDLYLPASLDAFPAPLNVHATHDRALNQPQGNYHYESHNQYPLPPQATAHQLLLSQAVVSRPPSVADSYTLAPSVSTPPVKSTGRKRTRQDDPVEVVEKRQRASAEPSSRFIMPAGLQNTIVLPEPSVASNAPAAMTEQEKWEYFNEGLALYKAYEPAIEAQKQAAKEQKARKKAEREALKAAKAAKKGGKLDNETVVDTAAVPSSSANPIIPDEVKVDHLAPPPETAEDSSTLQELVKPVMESPIAEHSTSANPVHVEAQDKDDLDFSPLQEEFDFFRNNDAEVEDYAVWPEALGDSSEATTPWSSASEGFELYPGQFDKEDEEDEEREEKKKHQSIQNTVVPALDDEFDWV